MTDRDRIISYLKSWVGYTEKDTRDKIGASMDSPEPFAVTAKTIIPSLHVSITGKRV